MEKASKILVKACEYDSIGRRLEALKLYEDGIKELLLICKNETDQNIKKYLHQKLQEYMIQAENIKKRYDDFSTKGQVIDRFHIMDGTTGYGYERIFGKYLTSDVREIDIEEPYLRETYQLSNLVMFLELCTKKCSNLKYIKVTTSPDTRSSAEQNRCFTTLKKNLNQRAITFEIELKGSLHDRQIIFSTGYIFKIGRGLDFYKPTENRYCLGFTDYHFRECKETNVDIFKC